MMGGGMPPGMMGGGMPPFMQPPAKKKRRDRKRSGRGGSAGLDGAAGGGSSSESSSSESSDAQRQGVMPPAAMAAMAAMWPGARPPMGGPGMPPLPYGGVPGMPADVEAFLASMPGIDPEAADRLRCMPPHLQQAVLRRGPISDKRNASRQLMARIREAQDGARGGGPASDGPPRPPAPGPSRPVDILDDGPKPARKSAKVTIEQMIRDYRLSPGCAWMMRALPPDKQKLVARIDPSGQADPSGYVAEEMKKIV